MAQIRKIRQICLRSELGTNARGTVLVSVCHGMRTQRANRKMPRTLEEIQLEWLTVRGIDLLNAKRGQKDLHCRADAIRAVQHTMNLDPQITLHIVQTWLEKYPHTKEELIPECQHYQLRRSSGDMSYDYD